MHEAAAGRDQGKTGPTCLIAATDQAVRPGHVVLPPVTDTTPGGDLADINVPMRVGRALGLDDTPGWAVLSEHNVVEWPNAGHSTLPGQPGTYSYGIIPPALFSRINAYFLGLGRSKESRALCR
ncbi:MAG: hypothetical protein OXI66_06670 [Boseongicola sp.]|nr:hypothetical protein [Boseongicola sp.]